MVGVVKKMMTVSQSMSGKECVDFDSDISIALEYTGLPLNFNGIPLVLPVDVDQIPTAKVAPSPTLLGNLALPVVDPIVKSNFRGAQVVGIGSRTRDLKNPVTLFEDRFRDGNSHGHDHDRSNFRVSQGVRLSSRVGGSKNPVTVLEHRFRDENDIGNENCKATASDQVYTAGSFKENGESKGFVCKGDDSLESSGTLGFSDRQDNSRVFSESSDMAETPTDCQEIEVFENYINSPNRHYAEANIEPQVFSNEIWCEEEEESDGEALECRWKRKPAVTFCEPDTTELVDEEESMSGDESVVLDKRVAEKPPKRGMCYYCHRGNRFTEKEACIVCDAKYCKCCIIRVMGSLPEGRKCLACIGYPVDESKRNMLGKCSSMLKRLLSEPEAKKRMEVELSCPANQLPPNHIFVNGSPLSSNELSILLGCLNPPKNLKPGNYWYDKVSGFWGKEGKKPCKVISPNLNVGDRIKKNASNGDTKVQINNREITSAEKWALKFDDIQCAGNPCFWVYADGTYLEEGMKLVKGPLWCKKRTKLLCTILSLPTPRSLNPGVQLNHVVDGGIPAYVHQRALCKVLLVGSDHSGTSTIYKQARVRHGNPFSEEERQDIKFIIQSNLYGYLARLLEGREEFEEESLFELRRRWSTNEPGPSAAPSKILDKTEYTIGPRLKSFSDWLINIFVSGNLDIIFPAATREYAPYVEELWKDAAIQATYSRRDELELSRVASYFLDKAIEIAKEDYEPSDTDFLYAEGFSSFNGLVSMELQLPPLSNDSYRDAAEQPEHITDYQLVRVQAKSLGENCKWLEMFEDFGIFLFCVALTDYDEYVVTNSGALTIKMLESRRLFESIVTHPTFGETNFLLLLNKFDLFEEKIEHVPLTHCNWFQDFNPVLSHNRSNRRSGSSLSPLAERGFHYVAAKFKSLYKSLTGKKLYVCPVTALESDLVENALKYAREIHQWEEDKFNFSLVEPFSESNEIEQSDSQY